METRGYSDLLDNGQCREASLTRLINPEILNEWIAESLFSDVVTLEASLLGKHYREDSKSMPLPITTKPPRRCESQESIPSWKRNWMTIHGTNA